MNTDLLRSIKAGLILLAWGTGAQAAEATAPDAALIEKLKEAVIKELRESGELDRAIDAGVSRYIDRQRAEAAQRERRELLQVASQPRQHRHVRAEHGHPCAMGHDDQRQCKGRQPPAKSEQSA